MNTKKLNQSFKEIKETLKLDYALNRGFYAPTPTLKRIIEMYGKQAQGIYVRWFGKEQEQPPLKDLKEAYIFHDLNKIHFDSSKQILIEILKKYFMVEWNLSMDKSIKIKDTLVCNR